MLQKREEKLQRLFRRLKKNNILHQIIYKIVYPTGSAPAKIYGLPKMHKLTPSKIFSELRPIVSSIGSYYYKLAKYLCGLLSPRLPMDHCTEGSFSFVETIKSVSLKNTIFVSCNIASPFANTSLKETKELAVNFLLKKEPNLKIFKTHPKKLFQIAPCET